MEACVTSNRRFLLVASVVFHKNVFPDCRPLYAIFFSFFELSSLFPQFLRALNVPVFASHPVTGVWRTSLFAWNHYGEGSWHVQVEYLREARHQVSVSRCHISGLLSPAQAVRFYV